MGKSDVKENPGQCKLTGVLLAGLVQLAACGIIYYFRVPNPNIVLFVIMTATLVKFGYGAGIISGVIAFLYSAFFFSTDHSWIYYTPLNLHKLLVITAGIVANILLIGHLHKKSNEAVELVTKLKLEQQVAGKANQAKTTFLMNMSHDIRTPLNGIIGLLKIDEAHFADRQLVLANHKKMMVAADHLLALINDVLQLSKLENCTVKLAHEVVDLAAMTSDIETIIVDRAAEAGIVWDYDKKQSSLPQPYVYGSPLHLRQIFLNIYGNCIKYNHAGGRISTVVELLEQKDGHCVYRWQIRDTGIGMSEEYVKHIFEPFSQEHTDARSVYQGTGVGMSIVKGLVEQMHGTITVTSKEGKGSCFEIVLPFELAQAPSKAMQAQTGQADINGLSLMLVEDNSLNAEIAQVLLQDCGARVIVVSDGRQAVELFSSKPPKTFDAILMDVMMPVMDGLTATKTIRALQREDAAKIPIIAMTANAFQEDAKKCLEAGMNAHLTKPLDIEKIKRTICAALA